MKEPKRRQNLGGAVLIMILTVMFVLIILLTATLTTVTTANQRIYTKFEENQAYYTARSALDVFTQNMLKDADYIAQKDGSGDRDFDYTDPSAASNPQHEKMKQGLALQLDLYKIKSQNEDGKDLGIAENPVYGNGIFPTDPEDRHYTMDNDTGLPYIEYQVTLPKIGSNSSDYGKFVDTKSASDSTQLATIRVEVLDRRMATDPYSPEEVENYFGGDHSVIANDNDLKTAIANAQRNMDYMKLKVTSKVTLLGTEGLAVVIIETIDKDMPATDRALTTSGNITVGSGASADILGGSAGMNTGTIPLPDGNGLGGTLFSMGDIQGSSAANNLTLNDGDAIVASGGLKVPTNSTHITATADGTYMFLGGLSELKGYIGDFSHGIDILADTVKCGNGTLDYYGNMYVNNMNLEGDQAKILSGNAYINNAIVLNGGSLWLDGDGHINMSMQMADAINNLHPIFSSSFQISDGTYVIDSSNIGDVICQNGRVLTYSVSSFRTINFSNNPSQSSIWDEIKDVDGSLYRIYKNLPFSINGQNSIELPTAQSYFHEYFKDDAFNPATGDLGLYQGPGTTPDYTEYDIATIYADSNKDQLLKTGATLLEDYLDVADADRTDNIAAVVAANSIPVLPATTGNYQIDLSSGDVIYKLTGTYNGLNLEVTGEGGRLLLLVEEGDSVTFNGLGAGMSIISDKTSGANNTNYVNYSATKIKNGTTKAPRVDIYAGTNAEIKCQNNVFVGGYFMMPSADLRWDNGKPGWSVTYNDDPATVSNIAIVGSVLCRNIYVGQHISIMYLDKDSGKNTPGEPHLTVQSSQYVRS